MLMKTCETCQDTGVVGDNSEGIEERACPDCLDCALCERRWTRDQLDALRLDGSAEELTHCPGCDAACPRCGHQHEIGLRVGVLGEGCIMCATFGPELASELYWLDFAIPGRAA